MKRAGRCAVAAIAALSFACFAMGPASARPWKPLPKTLAMDYGVITDVRPNNEVIIVIWFASPMAPESPEAQALLDKYVLLGVADAHITAAGITFDPIDTPQPLDTNGKPLSALQSDKIPPDLGAVLAKSGDMLSKSMGQFGAGVHLFAYEDADVHSCEKGRLSVPYGGEVYTFDTPFPGCPPQQ